MTEADLTACPADPEVEESSIGENILGEGPCGRRVAFVFPM